MILNICENCKHGTVKHGRSHCGKEHVYSHLTACLRYKALEQFLKREAVLDLNPESVS